MDTLVIPQSLLFRGLERLAARPAEPLFLSVGLRRDVERHDWLARDLLETPPAGPSFRIQTGLDPQLVAADTHVTGFLSFGVGAAKGAFEGIVRRGVQLRRLDRLSLVGPRMELVDLGPQTGDRVNDAGVTGTVDWSRTIGALGDPSTHQTLRRLRIAVVGAGRTG
jgi:hypothetical protein